MSPDGYPLPASEEERAVEISAYDLPDPRQAEALEQICALARNLFQTEGALISVVGREEQRFLASVGLDDLAPRTPRASAFCAWTILQEKPLTIPDLTKDPRFASHPMVAGPSHLRFYAGAPLLIRPGVALGGLCLVDTKPRDLTPEETERLTMLAGLAVNELRRSRRLVDLAYRDALTGLPNRAFLQEKLQGAIEQAGHRSGKVGLIVLDLDHFKDVNNSLGLEAGDALLRSVAERLTVAYRKTDIVARLGSDEFAVVLPDIASTEDLHRPTAKLVELLRGPLEHGGESLSITASVGAALYPEDQDDALQLLKNADIALRRAKADGRNRIVAYTPAMRRALEQRLERTRQVRQGVAQGEFALHYQPVVAVAPPGRRARAGGVVGLEALMRWRHPKRGLLTPVEFMEAFENQELALELGEIALTGAVRQIRAWLDEGLEFGRVAVNISPAQFRTARLAQMVLDTLKAHDAPAERLAIEVTENVYVGWGAEVVGDTLRTLSAAGVEVALDDFGTGYASLANLRQFPIDRLKIDRAFVQNQDDREIVRAVVNLGAALGMKVTAEGVETPAQLAFLSECGCDDAQGFHIARPMPPEDVPAFVTGRPGAALRLV